MLKASSILVAACLGLAACQCRAEVVATLPSKTGVIEFTDTVCPYIPGKQYVISRDPDGSYIEGCWRYADERLFVEWPGVGNRVYPVDAITFTPYALRHYSKPKPAHQL